MNNKIGMSTLDFLEAGAKNGFIGCHKKSIKYCFGRHYSRMASTTEVPVIDIATESASFVLPAV